MASAIAQTRVKETVFGAIIEGGTNVRDDPIGILAGTPRSVF
jgi:hypothetical protein